MLTTAAPPPARDTGRQTVSEYVASTRTPYDPDDARRLGLGRGAYEHRRMDERVLRRLLGEEPLHATPGDRAARAAIGAEAVCLAPCQRPRKRGA
jgi:hypothetical protein